MTAAVSAQSDEITDARKVGILQKNRLTTRFKKYLCPPFFLFDVNNRFFGQSLNYKKLSSLKKTFLRKMDSKNKERNSTFKALKNRNRRDSLGSRLTGQRSELKITNPTNSPRRVILFFTWTTSR